MRITYNQQTICSYKCVMDFIHFRKIIDRLQLYLKSKNNKYNVDQNVLWCFAEIPLEDETIGDELPEHTRTSQSRTIQPTHANFVRSKET